MLNVLITAIHDCDVQAPQTSVRALLGGVNGHESASVAPASISRVAFPRMSGSLKSKLGLMKGAAVEEEEEEEEYCDSCAEQVCFAGRISPMLTQRL